MENKKAHIFLHKDVNSIRILMNCLSRQPALRKWIKTKWHATCTSFPFDYNNEWPFPHECLRNFRVVLDALGPEKTFSFLARLRSYQWRAIAKPRFAMLVITNGLAEFILQWINKYFMSHSRQKLVIKPNPIFARECGWWRRQGAISSVIWS